MLEYKRKYEKNIKYNFLTYLKEFSGYYFLGKTSLILNNKKGLLLSRLAAAYTIHTFAYYFLKTKNIFNYRQFMFMIKSNTKQYFLSFLGYNVLHFKTASTGKILKKKNLLTKSLKSSSKADKYLLSFFNEYNANPEIFISYYLLKPMNRKNLNFYYLILKTFKIVPEFVGYYHYYIVTHKTARRIKKRIKKKLIRKHMYYS